MLVRIAPFLGLGLLSAILGFQLAGLFPQAIRIYSRIVFLFLLLGLIILDTEPIWNVVLFICFGVTAGMILFHSVPDLNRLMPRLLFVILLAVSLVGGSLISDPGSRATGVLFLCILLYMIGWLLLAFIQSLDQVGVIWTILGLALFTFIAMVLFSQCTKLNLEESIIPLSIQLFVVLFNLCWLTSML